MSYLKEHRKTALRVIAGLASALFSTAAIAHSGHGQLPYNDTWAGVLHTITTHPLIFSVLGLTIVAVAYLSRD